MLSCHISFLFSLLSGFQVSQVVERRPYLVFDPADASLKPKPLLNTRIPRHVIKTSSGECFGSTTFPSFPWNPGNKNWNKKRHPRKSVFFVVVVVSNPRSEFEAPTTTAEQFVSSCSILCDSYQEVWHFQSHSQMKRPFIIKNLRYLKMESLTYVSRM